MGLDRRTWPPEDHDDYEVACADAWDCSGSTVGRGQRFSALVRTAADAGALWARDLLKTWVQRGAEGEVKNWKRRTTPTYAVAYNGRLVNRYAVGGVKRRTEDGEQFHAQTLFELMTWDQLENKIREYVAQISAYKADIALIAVLLKLRDAAPETATPHEAAKALGTTVREWIGQQGAA